MAFAAVCLAQPPARANDTIAALTTGGLRFSASADIEMRAEALSVSRREIVVRYRFFNRSAAAQKVLVAFPMPDVDMREGGNVSVPDEESDNFLKFHTVADGREIQALLEQKAFLGEADVTARLAALRLPLQPRARKTQAALDALPKDAQERLLKEKLARVDEYDVGKGMERHIAPEWRVKTTYYWEQTFPAGREIVVEHRYEPSVGASVGTMVGRGDADPAETREYRTRYCADAAFVKSVAALARKREGGLAPEYRIAYVLKTGANWAGPIGDFTLTIDKGRANALVSFCESNVVKTSATTFVVHKTNFTPVRDLDVLIVDPVVE